MVQGGPEDGPEVVIPGLFWTLLLVLSRAAFCHIPLKDPLSFGPESDGILNILE